jgi:feruloyl esterase
VVGPVAADLTIAERFTATGGKVNRLPATLALLAAAAPTLGADQSASCDLLSKANLFPHTTVSSTREIAADVAKKIPAHCEVVATISPVAGSRIGVVYRLPQSWNGKMVGIGGGGYAGNLLLIDPASNLDSVSALTRGYATAQTDTGHPGTSVWDSSWVTGNAEAVTDFAYRAVNEMTRVGRAVVAKHYGRNPSRAYFSGCSTGGRQGLMESQRFPQDYDGIIAGAPVYSLVTQTNLLLRWQTLGPTKLTSAQLNRLHQAMLEACDMDDGVKDGIVTESQTCKFDPAVLQCSASVADEHCLSPEQVAGVRTAYAGQRTSRGEIAAYPLTHGSEPEWDRFIGGPESPTTRLRPRTPQDGGLSGFRAVIFGDPNYDLSRFDAERDLTKMRASAFANAFEADDPDISAFVKRGGKLLLWHGADDPGPSAAATIDYYKEVLRTTGPKVPSLTSSVRLFIAPGVFHCRRGPGPDQFNLLDALDRWVEKGVAPATIIATKQDSPLSRPLCPYPALPRYGSSGDPNAASSYACRSGK